MTDSTDTPQEENTDRTTMTSAPLGKPHQPDYANAPDTPAVQSESGNVRQIEVAGKQIYLIGTAHISARSTQEVREVIASVRPDTVSVELCQARHQALTKADRWREMNLFQVVRQRKATLLLMHLVLAAFQRRMGDQLGVKPGAEMLAAVEAAETINAKVDLADREIQTTLRRTWRMLTWWDKLKLVLQMMLSLVAREELTEQEVERLKTQDLLSEVMENFARAFPRAKTTLIDERDRYMAHHIRNAPGQTIVAVIGAGHMEGILRQLPDETTAEDLLPLSEIPPRGKTGLVVQWGLPVLVVGLVGYGFATADAAASWEMIKIWFLANGLLSGLGAALALAHPATVLAAMVAAPLTSLNPLVAAGWVAGLVQVLVNKPKVRDFETLPQDITSVRGFWRNSVTRILLVVALANLGSTAGTFLALPLMTSLLG